MQRCAQNPILTRSHIPAIHPDLVDATSVFNPGAAILNDQYMLMLRVQGRSRKTHFVMADSGNGVDFNVRNYTVQLSGIETVQETIFHCYDARITRMGDVHYIMFAMDMAQGCRLGLARTTDFASFAFMGIVSGEDNRNGVLFPEKIGGRYVRFDRPNTVQLKGGPTSGQTIFLSESDDLLQWRPVAPVMAGRFHYWDENIGSGPAPVKTRQGWLHIYHGVAGHFGSVSIYQAGVALHALADPSQVLARSWNNILEPREPYEMIGQVPNVVFPSGMIVEEYDADGFARDSSRVLIYYGAADTAVGLATTTIADLINAAHQ